MGSAVENVSLLSDKMRQNQYLYEKNAKVLTVDGCPHGVFLEKTHSLDVVLGVGSKSMVDAGGKNKQVALLNGDADPLVAFATNVEETTSIQYVSNFLVFVEMSISDR